MSQNLIPIRLNTLKPNVPLGFALLLKLNQNYIKYVNAEDGIEQHRLDNLKSKGVKKVYIESADESKYHQFLDSLLNLAVKGGGQMEAAAKTAVIAGATADALEKVYSDPDNQNAYNQTKRAASSLVSATGTTPEMLKEIFNIDADDDISINCAICTSTTAVSLGRKLGLKAADLEILSLAGLLCDLSLPKLTENYQKFFTKNLSEFGAEEAKLYRQHPQKSAEILQNKDFSTPELLSIIANHEEKLNGKGFPKGISNLTMSEKIVALCNRFSILTTGMKMTRDAALKELILQDVGAYELEMINTLKSMVGGK